jgi:hypothetical protein
MIAEVLEKTGWQATEAGDWLLLWSARVPNKTLLAGAGRDQWINHFSGATELSVKSLLARHLAHHRKLMKDRPDAPPYDFFPETFTMPLEYGLLRKAAALDPSANWIRKPIANSNGRGVRLVTNLDQLAAGRPAVVQQYLDRPHLIDGCKYVFRLYAAMTSIDPLVLYFYNDGLTKVASKSYVTATRVKTDRLRHITNVEVQARNRDAVLGENTMTIVNYRRWLRSQKIDDEALFRRIKDLLICTFAAVREPMFRRQRRRPFIPRPFELYGIDVMVDADLKPWLIEVNVTPSLAINSAEQTQAARDERVLKETLVRDLFGMVGVQAPPPALESDESVIAHFDAEASRSGNFERIYPARDVAKWLPALTWPRHMDRVLAHHINPEVPVTPPAVRARGARSMALGRNLVLVTEATGVVRELNATAGYTWIRVEEGVPASYIANEVADQFGQPVLKVRNDVDAAIGDWIDTGLADLAVARRKSSTLATLRFALAGLAVEVRIPSDLAKTIESIAPPGSGREPVVGVIQVLPEMRGYLLRTGEGIVMACDHVERLGSALRAFLVQRVAHRADGIGVPASAVRGPKGTILIPGSNDSHRSRLALACSLTGMDLICDELALLDESFAVLPTRLPPSLPGLDVSSFEEHIPRVGNMPAHCLSSGVPVRYLPSLAPQLRGAFEITGIVLPVPGKGRRNVLLPLDPCDVLDRLITLGLSRFPAADAKMLERFVRWLDHIPCWKVHAVDVWHAAEVIQEAAGAERPRSRRSTRGRRLAARANA